MTTRIPTKPLVVSLGILVVLLVGFDAYLQAQIEASNLESIQHILSLTANSIAQGAERQLRADDGDWPQLVRSWAQQSGVRVTVIDANGQSVADSEHLLTPGAGPAEEPELAAALRGERGVRTTTDGASPAMVFVAVPLQRDKRVVGAVRVGATSKNHSQLRLRLVLTLAILMTGCAAAAIVWATVRSQVRRLQALSTASRAIADGDLAVRVDPRGNDAIAEVSRALNDLTGKLESSLAESRQVQDRLSGVISGMQDGVLLLDPDGRVKDINATLRELLVLPADCVGRAVSDVVEQPELARALEAARAGETVSEEVKVSGLKPRRLLARAIPLDGGAQGVFASLIDITEMRRLETVRRDFVANVSHELRTPVTAILSASETLSLALANDPAAATSFVEIIERNATRLQLLVEDLLDLSRIESSEVQLDLETLDLGAVFDQVLELFRERAAKRHVVLDTELPQGLMVHTDRRALEHVLTNLVDNAVKYGGTRVQVRLSARTRDEMVEVRVSDTGVGIAPEHLPRLFERFYRVDTGRSRHLGGTGLGLSIVRHLTEAMGGGVAVSSRVGEGTTFTFTVPRA